MAAAVASGSTLAAAPPVPSAVGCLACAPALPGDSATTTAASVTGNHRTHLIDPPPSRSGAPLPRSGYVNPQHRGHRQAAAVLAHARDVDRVVGQSGGRERVQDACGRPRPQRPLVAGGVLVPGLVAEVAPAGRVGA